MLRIPGTLLVLALVALSGCIIHPHPGPHWPQRRVYRELRHHDRHYHEARGPDRWEGDGRHR